MIAAGCVEAGPARRLDPTKLETAVLSARAGNTSAGPIAWRLGEDGPLVDRNSGRQGPQDAQETQEQREARLRLQFGSNVLIGKDGSVTKQYFLVGELAVTFLKLITEIAPDKLAWDRDKPPLPVPGTLIGGPEAKSVLGRMLGEHVVELTYVPDFEVLSGANLVDPPQANALPAVQGSPLETKYKQAPSVGLALITAQPSALAAFEAALDLFYTSIPQIEITVNVLEYQTADALAFGVTPFDTPSGGTPIPILGNASSNQLVRAYSSAFPLRQPIVGTSPVTDIGRIALGGIHDTWELNAIIEVLEANNLADITSSPKLVVRNGGVAAISTLTSVPFPKAKISQLGAEVATDINFQPVGVRMNIIPVIAGTDSVILQIYADVSAITGFAATTPVETPITSTRSAVTTVYLKDGYTLVIGGLKSKTRFESETKVPILGDIPLLGFLFRASSTTHNDTTVEFHITPRIVKDRGAPPSRDQGF